MASELAALSNKRLESISEILGTVKSHKMTDNGTCHFLITLYRELEKQDNYKALDSVIETLNEILTQTQSRLISRWSELKLPESLDKIIIV